MRFTQDQVKVISICIRFRRYTNNDKSKGSQRCCGPLLYLEGGRRAL